jgi:hypothetical protein
MYYMIEPRKSLAASLPAIVNQLSFIFSDPDALSPANLDEEDIEELQQGIGMLLGISENGMRVFLDKWSQELERLNFPRCPVSLEESTYKTWTSEKSHPMKGAKGLSQGDSACHMSQVLSSLGFSFGGNISPDHISVLLEFWAYLLERDSIEESILFCRDHLNWMPDLERKAREEGFVTLALIAGGVSRAVIQLTSERTENDN